jgi:peptidylprolyl isomerase
VRKTAAIVLAVGLILPLAACSSEADDAADVDCTPTASGALSDAVEVSGAFGEKPEVTIETPVTAETTERTVAIEGDGAVATDANSVTVDYTMFNGTTGEEIDVTPYDGETTAAFPLDGSLIAGLTSTLLCSTEGSRVVGVVAPADGLNETALAQYGMTTDDSLVMVIDVVEVTETEAAEEEVVLDPSDYLAKADGVDQPLPDGFPAVDVAIADDESGTPTVTIPDTEAPADLQIATLKVGDGEEIQDGDDVVVNYQGTIWATKVVFDSSWARGAISHFPTDQVVEGFGQALVGQTIGSQVLVTIPPSLGYGEAGNSSAGISGTDTLVFIVDILGTVVEE